MGYYFLGGECDGDVATAEGRALAVYLTFDVADVMGLDGGTVERYREAATGVVDLTYELSVGHYVKEDGGGLFHDGYKIMGLPPMIKIRQNF